MVFSSMVFAWERFGRRESGIRSDNYNQFVLEKILITFEPSLNSIKIIMMRRSFQLSGSYDIIRDATDLASKSLGFQFLRFF